MDNAGERADRLKVLGSLMFAQIRGGISQGVAVRLARWRCLTPYRLNEDNRVVEIFNYARVARAWGLMCAA